MLKQIIYDTRSPFTDRLMC